MLKVVRREYAAIRVGLKLFSPDSFPLKLASVCVCVCVFCVGFKAF